MPSSKPVENSLDAPSYSSIDSHVLRQAVALRVRSPAPVAEFVAAPAGHMVARLALLDPELALCALLILLPLDELDRCFLGEVGVLRDPVLRAGQALVIKHTAVQTVSVLAFLAPEVEGAGLVGLVDEGHAAVGGGAPRNVWLLRE